MTSTKPIEKRGAELHKVMPKDVELEKAVLGALLLESDSVYSIQSLLNVNLFYKDQHKVICRAILELFNAGDSIDTLTVSQKVRAFNDSSSPTAYDIAMLTQRVESSANLEYHMRVLMEYRIKRSLINFADKLKAKAFNESQDALELLESSENYLYKVQDFTEQKKTLSLTEVKDLARKEINEARERKLLGLSPGISSGFEEIDVATGGLVAPDLILLAARPGMGKTSLMLCIAWNTAKYFNNAVHVISLEMSSVQLVKRLVSIVAKVDLMKLLRGSLDDAEAHRVELAYKEIDSVPIYFDDVGVNKMSDLRGKAVKNKLKNNTALIMVDYVQIMSGDGKSINRDQEIGKISRALKQLAKELHVPIIALAQLSRALATRGGDMRPRLTDLRESGALEQDADQVWFLHRPEYYGMTEDADGNSTHGVAEIGIAKFRNGAPSNIYLRFVHELTLFKSLESEDMKGLIPVSKILNNANDQQQNSEAVDKEAQKARGQTPPF